MKQDEIRKAAALKYNVDTDDAPYVVALGKGVVATKMIESARENDVQVVKDDKLVNALSELGIGDEIPEELYKVVAELLVFISDLDSGYLRGIADKRRVENQNRPVKKRF